ncbi:transcriptional regulator [Arenicella chitinivorans]|uniref:Transcriptional regulator n=1 Tax=Arenicella chitinivorans TaxID=1329800 RepID=A0A918RUM6_9GAMM|nr:LysR family transcriptional regulator [Arenicella chitinivorans]GHA10678.1 transcriptional regulator [Arenicella chitinivorans]
MIDDLRAMAIFATTVQHGTFRAAAKQLNLSPSVVSYTITALEKRLQTTLLYRSTRKLSLTAEGESLYRHAVIMLDAASRGLNAINQSQHELRGRLSISITSALLESALNEALSAFLVQHPSVYLNLEYSDQQTDLIGRGVDLAIRAGQLEDSSLKSRRLGQIPRTLVCSKAYFDNQAAPTSPHDLAQWDWVQLGMMPLERTLTSPEGETQAIRGRSRLTVNSVVAMTQYCVAGMGLCTPPAQMVTNAIEQGILIEVLPGWQVTPIPYYALWPNTTVDNEIRTRLLSFLHQRGIVN